MDKICELYSDPYMLAISIIVVLNIIIFFMFQPEVPKKTYFRGFMYMSVVIISLTYLHHTALKNTYDSKLNQNLNMSLVSKVGNAEEEIQPNLTFAKPIIEFTENELV